MSVAAPGGEGSKTVSVATPVRKAPGSALAQPRAVLHPRRAAPTFLAAILAAAYVILSPPSGDLAAHLLRAKLFSAEGFGLWSNWWYAGHHDVLYSVLFPPVAAAITPQLAAALAATATAGLFEALVRSRYGERAWLGALWFGAATATGLFTGRLTFAFGLLPAMAAVLALQRGRPRIAFACALLTALSSPVAALFLALAATAHAIGGYATRGTLRVALSGLAAAGAALVPVLALSIAFPEGGSEPFAFSAFWPIPVICAVAVLALSRDHKTLRAGIVLYGLVCVLAFALSSAVGSNATRLATLCAGPLAALMWWRRRTAVLLAVAPVLLYIQWQAPVRDVRGSIGQESASSGYFQPLLRYLARQPGAPFRVEIPFTRFHVEAYAVAPRFPLARGWERQLDIAENRLFYGGVLTAPRYRSWLDALAVRFVAVPDSKLDYSARAERALVDQGLPYLELALRTRHWRIYAVRSPTPLVQGAAALREMGPNSLALVATRPGTALVRVRFTPYWALAGASGCVAPEGEFTKVTVRRPGPVRLVIRFSLERIGARSPRCG